MFRPRGPDDGGIADVEFSKEITITSRTLTLADYETLVGTKLAVSDWKSVDQAQVNQFGEASRLPIGCIPTRSALWRKVRVAAR